MKLTDICDVQGGSQPPKEEWSFEEQEGYIRMLQIRDFTQSERVTPEYIKISNSTKICEADDILIARYGASIGKILTGLAGAYNVAIMRTIPDTSKIKKKYLYYYLKSPYFQNAILNVGSRAAQAGFNKEDLSKLDIECPELSEQENIASILDKVEIVIRKRKEELVFLDKLIKARFVEMFGDVKINPHNYKKFSIKSVLKSCEAGWSGNGTQRIRKDDEIAVLKVSAVTKGYFIPEECKVLDDQENIKKYVIPEKGDLLFSRANTREMVGATAIVKEDYPSLILPDKLWKIKFKDNTPKGGSENYVEEGITFFRSQNVWKDRLEMDDIVYIDAETHASMKRSSLKHGDILMTKTGRINTENSSLGRAALYDGEDDMANVNGHVYFIRLKEGVNNKFVLRILVSPEYRELIRSVCVGGIDKRQLNKEHIEDFPIICPPSDRVNEYVAFVEQVDKSKVIDTNIIPRGGFYNGNEFCISK